MNTKGFWLAEETLKTVVAVIAIVFLAWLLVSLYNSFTSSKNLDQAKATLPSILNAVTTSKTSVDVYNPDSWWISYWPRAVEGSETVLPKSCSNAGLKSCICICKTDTPDSCDSDGYCQDSMSFFVLGGSIQISNPPITLNINQQIKRISKK